MIHVFKSCVDFLNQKTIQTKSTISPQAWLTSMPCPLLFFCVDPLNQRHDNFDIMIQATHLDQLKLLAFGLWCSKIGYILDMVIYGCCQVETIFQPNHDLN